MDETARLLYLVTDLICPLIVGYFIHKRQLLSGGAINRMIKVNVIVFYTLLSVSSFWVLPITADLLFVPIYAFLVVLIPGAIGYLYARREPNLLDRGPYVASALLANIGTLDGVCAFILYNEEGFAYTQIVATCQNILLVLVVFPLSQYFSMKYYKTNERKTTVLRSLRDLFLSPTQLSLVGMAAGILLNAEGIERPAFLGPAFQWLIHVSAWIALLPVGYLINFAAIRRYEKRVRSLTVLHFIITPAIMGAIAYVFADNPIMRNTLLIIAFCPTAINAVLAARLYRLNTDLAVSSFFYTTVIFLLLIFPTLFFLLR